MVDVVSLDTVKSSKSAVVLVGLVVAVAVATSCSLFENAPHVYRFVATIDSIVVPDSVKSSDTLFVGLRGIISTDGCGVYDGFERTRSGGVLKYTVYGLHDDRRLCIETLVLFRPVDTVLPPQVNPTTISANNPPGAFPTSRTVLVK